jgi:hypothetical protein
LPTSLEEPVEASIADLVHQLVEDGRLVARSELNLYREIALYRINKAKTGAIALAGGALLSLAALITLLVMIAMGLAVQVGPVAAGLIVAAVAALVGYLLIRFGVNRIKVLGGDADEKRALERGEIKA